MLPRHMWTCHMRHLCSLLLLASCTGQAAAAWFLAQGELASGAAGDVMTASAAAPTTLKPVEELMLPKWRGMDWTYAGYREGNVALPSPPVTINVRFQAYGAKGNGVTDDTAALQRAVDAANASPTGGVIFLPAGTYLLSQPITITQTNVVLRGAGEGRTTIRINRSLSDVFAGTWTANGDGTVTSAWSSGGAFINFRGSKQKSNQPRTLLAAVRQGRGLLRGGRVLPVTTTAGFSVGQRIRIFLNDKSTLYTRRRLQAATGGPGRKLAARGAVATVPTPAWVRRHPAYLAAMEGAAELGESGPGLTPAQAAAADADFARRSGASGPTMGASAAAGTVVAWLYGGNVVDSGPATGATDMDEIQCHAVVTAVGNLNVTLDRPLCFPVQASWQASVHRDEPRVQEGGVEFLRVVFNHTLSMPHHGDRGYNAFQISFVTNFWVRNVTILNADNGLFASWVDRSTLTDVKVGVSALRVNPLWPNAWNGHHPISLTTNHGTMLRRFRILTRYIHDVTVTAGSSLNVVMEGKGVDMNLDHHRTAPWANLFTNLDLGLGTRPFASGGAKNCGGYSGLLNTYYNLRRTAAPYAGAPVPLPACGFGPMLNFLGSFAPANCTSSLRWYRAALPRGAPANLYAAQRQQRARIRLAAQTKARSGR